ncbi:hypothetical protein WR25_03246 [Diploscapter pachys]|uniref:Ion transport domain-containing protein n=1 Tax=Diploscapter pachys TaxID=2018661 RepID=A0A2A2JQ54_9BILA|nr:hypothetical protein WR25_03246 [Diploscapter pachys]
MLTTMEFGDDKPPEARKKSLIQVQAAQKKHSQVAKAAVLSSAMLARKNSSGRGGGPAQFGARESIAAISDMLNTQQKKNARANYVVNEKLEWAMKIACTISLITVCLHTPKTFDLWKPLTYVVFMLDFVTLIIFIIEAIVRIHQEGFYKVFFTVLEMSFRVERSDAYLRARRIEALKGNKRE